MWFPILYQLRFFSTSQLLIFTNNLFFFFSWDIYGFTVGFSHTFTILYQLKFFSVGQLLIFTNNFFFFFWDIYGFTVGLSHTFTILYQLMFFSAGQLLIFTNNVFFFLWDIYSFSLCPPTPLFLVKSAFSPNCKSVITYIYFFLKSKNLRKFLQFGKATWRNHDI